MAEPCPACGNPEANGPVCSWCGLPLTPYDPGTQPAPAVPAPSVAVASTRKSKLGRKRLPLLIGAAVVALALVAGGAIAAVHAFSPGGALGGPVELKVTGTPPSIEPWANGYTEAWKLSPSRTVAQQDPGENIDNPYGYAGREQGVVAFTVDTTTASGTVLAVDASTGKQKWTTYSQEQCGGIVAGDLRCQGGRMGYYPTQLVVMKSGKTVDTPSSQQLGAKIPNGKEDGYAWGTFVIDGALYATWSAEEVTDNVLPKMYVARLADDGSRFVWQSDRALTGAKAPEPLMTTETGRTIHGLVTSAWGALDAKTGKVALDGAGSDQPAVVQWVAQDVLQGGDQTTTPRRITAPDGSSVSVIGMGGISVTTVALPKHPIRQTADGVAAFDPSTGADTLNGPTLWTAKLGPSSSGDFIDDDGTNSNYLLAYHDGLIALAKQPLGSRTGTVSMLAEDTGAVLWQAQMVVPAGSDKSGVIVPTFTADGQLLVQASQPDFDHATGRAQSELTMFDARSGDVLWARAGAVGGGRIDTLTSAPFAPEVEQDTGLIVDNLDGPVSSYGYYFAGTYSMLRAKAAAVGTPPSTAPSCPSGMTAISWTQYADGAILLCQADQRYAVVVPSHPDWQAGELDFSGGGYQVAFTNGTSVRVSLGGTVVYTDANGTVTAEQATGSWNNASGTVKLTVPSDLKTCPAGSWPISLSTYDGGWLLVCGTAADAPTSMIFSDGSTVTDVGTVTVRNGGYCGTATSGTVCGYRSPAVVTVTDPSGKVTQHSADANYFDGHGQGGTGIGNGSYGVEAPDDNAKDQVRYLTQILQKSAAGRTNLQTAVDKVRNCTDLAGAISSFNDVLANRQELLDALDSTPVDALPDGSDLVASLRNALQLSHDSDQVWLQWAQAEQTNNCADGENNALYQQVQSMNEQVATAKDSFLEIWNSQIVPSYGAPEFKTSQI